jgi:hypothetical protein
MSWKGNLRTGIAFARRIERSEKRRASNATKQYKSMLKQEAFENGQRAVQEYNDYIELISSTHKDTSEQIDWHDILSEAEPAKPILLDKKQKDAEQNLTNYTPSFFDKLFGSTKKKLQRLEAFVVSAKGADKNDFENSLKQYNTEYNEWKKYQDFAKGVLSSDIETYKKILEHLDPFSDIKELGSGLDITFEKEYLTVTLSANGVTVIPDFILTQTSTGKVSKKKMPVGKFYELYQDYICSCVLRVAREVISFLPLNCVFVNVQSEMVNPVNGHLEQQTILSVAIPATTLDKLNFETIDPSDSMKNFIYNMKFSKTMGFSVVSAISPSDIKL